jgi:hypothetical protein
VRGVVDLPALQSRKCSHLKATSVRADADIIGRNWPRADPLPILTQQRPILPREHDLDTALVFAVAVGRVLADFAPISMRTDCTVHED